ARDKEDLCPWALCVGKDKHTQNWLVKTYRDTHKCLQSREIEHYTYKFLSEKIFDQVRVNPDIPVKAVQYQLQRDLEVQISMSKSFRAKSKAKREIRGYHGQVLVVVGLDSNNGIYPLAYALVEAESKSSWCWFLQCLGNDIDLHPNSNFTFISDRQKGIITAIKTVYPIIMEYLVNISKRRAFWSLNKDILKIIILTTNTPYPSRKIRRIRACTHQRPQRKQV
ncbi:putative ribonuclease H-like domain-containing protein, partial [Tanacetum coccineum]